MRTTCTQMDVGEFIPKVSSQANDLRATTSNITSTGCLLQSKLPSLKKFIFISSVDVYGNAEGIINEQTQVNPSTLYGWSKLFCEAMVKTYCDSCGINYQILHLGHVYGEGEEKYRKVMPIMIQKAIMNEDIEILGDGLASRAYIYVDDVAKAVLKSLSLMDSNVINIVGDRSVNLNELAEKIVRLSGSKSRIIHKQSNVDNRYCEFDNSLLRQVLLSYNAVFEECLFKEIESMKSFAS